MALYPAELRVPRAMSYPRSGRKGQPANTRFANAAAPTRGREIAYRGLLPQCFRRQNPLNEATLPDLLKSCFRCIKLVHPTGFEPVASAFGGQRSIQLSYGCLGRVR